MNIEVEVDEKEHASGISPPLKKVVVSAGSIFDQDGFDQLDEVGDLC